jgi:hypothetical protein
MRRTALLIGVLTLIPLSLSAGEPQSKQDYAEFSRLLHTVVVSQLPKQFEDNSGWDQLIPAPQKLPLPQLRKYVKVGEKMFVPHGSWRRFKGTLENPDKNLKIVVKDFKQLDDKTYRIVVDVDAIVLCNAEWQQWQKGLQLVGLEAAGDATFTSAMVCDIGVSLNFDKFPPVLNISPKVSDLRLNLVDFKLRNGPLLKGEKGEALTNEVKDVMRAFVKASEPTVKDYANKILTQSLKEGKGTISASSIMKTLPESKK